MAYERDRHHLVKHTCQVKGRTTSGRSVTITVAGRPTEVRARIEARIQQGAQRMTLIEYGTGREVEISLAAGDKVAVK